MEDWNDERGFGFIAPKGGGSRLFAHVSAFPRGPRPVIGCEVTYVEGRDESGRARASVVRYPANARSKRSGHSGVPLALAVLGATLFLSLLVVLQMQAKLPGWLVAVYGLLSMLTFLTYGADKAAAKQGRWRTSEPTLHVLALAGGWPGALIARRSFRHKTKKQPFATIFWFTVAINSAMLGWFLHNGISVLR